MGRRVPAAHHRHHAARRRRPSRHFLPCLRDRHPAHDHRQLRRAHLSSVGYRRGPFLCRLPDQPHHHLHTHGRGGLRLLLHSRLRVRHVRHQHGRVPVPHGRCAGRCLRGAPTAGRQDVSRGHLAGISKRCRACRVQHRPLCHAQSGVLVHHHGNRRGGKPARSDGAPRVHGDAQVAPLGYGRRHQPLQVLLPGLRGPLPLLPHRQHAQVHDGRTAFLR